MKCVLGWSLLIVGFLLIVYFAFVFMVFNSTKNPMLLPFMGEPIVFSIGFMVVGIILIIAGILILRNLRKAVNP
ncbi:MAG: hypothetical protein V1681_03820 [Candidatus Neomarinimicrobiota bacterium]